MSMSRHHLQLHLHCHLHLQLKSHLGRSLEKLGSGFLWCCSNVSAASASISLSLLSSSSLCFVYLNCLWDRRLKARLAARAVTSANDVRPQQLPFVESWNSFRSFRSRCYRELFQLKNSKWFGVSSLESLIPRAQTPERRQAVEAGRQTQPKQPTLMLKSTFGLAQARPGRTVGPSKQFAVWTAT